MSDEENENVDHKEELVTKLRLRIHAANLPRHGVMLSLPDTYAIVTSVSGRASRGGPSHYVSDVISKDTVMETVEWGRTEVIYKNCHPQWTHTFDLNYEFGSECYFVVKVLRLNGSKDEETLGNAVCEIGDILGSKNHTKVKRLPKGGVVFCRFEPVREENKDCIFRFQLGAQGLKVGRKSLNALSPFSSAPDTVVQISKRHPHATRLSWITVYRSRPVENSFDPTWDAGEIDLESVCNGEYDRPLRLAVLVCKKNARDVVVAECETTLRMILHTQRDINESEAEEEATKEGFPLQRSMKKQKHVGRLRVRLAQVVDTTTDEEVTPLDNRMSMNELPPNTEDPYTVDMANLPIAVPTPATFQDYIQAGFLLDFCVAIDFTSSNGDPRIPGTLHDQSYNVNDYEETIVAIGNAVSAYTGSLGTSVWGFGCKFGGTVRHIFQCGPAAEVHGVVGILNSYKSVFQSDLVMSGPTLFDEVIRSAAVRARQHQQENRPRYTVLLVVTDGICQNLEETKRKLNVYTSVPLSVVFVGVGRSDFKVMYDLCDDFESNATRKNTTFVEFRQHQHDPTSLGREALRHVPSQFVQYMVEKGISPS